MQPIFSMALHMMKPSHLSCRRILPSFRTLILIQFQGRCQEILAIVETCSFLDGSVPEPSPQSSARR